MYSVVEVELNGKWAMNMRAALECVQNTGRLTATTLMGLYTRTATSGNNAEIRDLCSAYTWYKQPVAMTMKIMLMMTHTTITTTTAAAATAAAATTTAATSNTSAIAAATTPTNTAAAYATTITTVIMILS